MNLPNQLTILRMLLVPVFMFVVLSNNENAFLYAAIVFAIASITDFLDGYIARKHNLVTNFGKLMDPLADKVLVSAALISLVELQIVPSWMVVLIITREFAISIIRAIAASSGVVIAASQWGKAKTTSQILAILMILLSIPFANYMLWLAVFLTVYSGYDYIRLNKDLLKG